MKSLKTSIKMKNEIEKLMKNALDGYEMSYQDGAWESFEKKINGKSKSTAYKWWILGAAAVIISTSSLYLYKADNIQNKINAELIKVKENSNDINEENVSSLKNKVLLNDIKLKENLNEIENDQKNNLTNNVDIIENTTDKTEKFDIHSSQTVTSNINSSTNFKENSQAELKIKNDQQNLNVTEIIPTYNDKCKNETILIDNKNSVELILKTPSGREIGIEPNSKSEINLKETGEYQLGTVNEKSNGAFRESSKFRVHGNPTINLITDETISYKNGLPTIYAEVNSSEENVTWKINQKTSHKSSKSVEFNFFNKGSYIISAFSKNEFGCESTESKKIQINEDYNLLAMSAFNPNSLDYRNSTFLPYALKERNVSFKMIILDPDNLGIVFETTEASNPWTGIDRRDGKLVPAQKAYIWKVSLSNPEPGEKSEYKGTIVRVP